MRRTLLMCLPAANAAIVAWAVLADAPGRVEFARVLGGPSRAGARTSLLVDAWTLEGDRRVPLPGLSLRLASQGAEPRTLGSAVTDANGRFETQVDLPSSPAVPWLRVERSSDGAVLAEGELALEVEHWRKDARSEGGWLAGQRSGELALEVAIADGVLAVPFAGQLILRVRDGLGAEARPVAGARVELELTGARLEAQAPPPITDARGELVLGLRPIEHALSLRASANEGTRRGQWYGALPVLPGALWAEQAAGSIVVRSPIVRDQAFLSVVSASERLAGAIVELTPQPDGSASGHFEPGAALLARLSSEPSWAIVSSEADKRSPAVVGWPLGAARAQIPAKTFAVCDRVLLDGQPGALADLAGRRSVHQRRAGAFLAAMAALTVALFWAEVRAHARPAAPGWAARNALSLAAALASIALGLGALAYFGWLQR